MLRKIVYCAAFSLFLFSCAITQTRQDTNPAYSEHHYQSHDLDIVWKLDKADTNVHITGTVTNPSADTKYQSFELTAMLLDKKGAVLAKKTFTGDSSYLAGSQNFNITIPLGDTALFQNTKFLYTYTIGEDYFTGNFVSVP